MRSVRVNPIIRAQAHRLHNYASNPIFTRSSRDQQTDERKLCLFEALHNLNTYIGTFGGLLIGTL